MNIPHLYDKHPENVNKFTFLYLIISFKQCYEQFEKGFEYFEYSFLLRRNFLNITR